MGNALNNPLDEYKQQRMQEIISDFMKTFATEFTIGYKDALIAKIRASTQPEEVDERLLPDIPIPDYPLKVGTLNKRGETVKNWKTRHFVVLNEADNFRIDYFEKEGGKLKGSINCSGYRVEDFNEDDVKENGEFGIKLVASDTRRRVWYVKCANEEERQEWVKVFKECCSNANAPVNPDEVISGAFQAAYRACRWRYGYWGWYRINYTETEQLGELIGQILSRELLNDVYYNIPAGPTRGAVISMVEKTVTSTVMAAVNAGWNASVQACSSLRATLESTATQLLTPFFEEENKLKAKINELTTSKVVPALKELGGKFCQPILRIIAAPITRAYVASIRGFKTFLENAMNDVNDNNFNDKITSLDRSVEWWWSGPLEQANQICWQIYSSDLADVVALFAGGFSTYSLYYRVLKEVRNITHRAIYAFKVAYEEGNKAIQNNIAEIIAKYVHDAGLSIQNLLNEIFTSVMSDSFESTVITPCLELVKPIQDVIEAIPVPGLSSLFNLTGLTEEVLSNLLNESIAAIVEGGFGEIDKQLEDAAKEFSVTRRARNRRA